MTDPEPDFTDHKSETQEAIADALSALTRVRAYTLTAEELADFKAAQYALRNLSPEFEKRQDVPDIYEVQMLVEGDIRDDQ